MAHPFPGSIDATEFKHVRVRSHLPEVPLPRIRRATSGDDAHWGEEAAEDRDEYIAENIF